MSRFIESIKLLDGSYYNLSYHEQRMNRALRSYYGLPGDVQLEHFLNDIQKPERGLFKCRIVYDDKTRNVAFSPYTLKSIRTLRLVEDNEVAYDHKFLDRAAIDKLFAFRGACDDILIIRKGMVTDTSFCNIVFRRDTQWITPGFPLLEGTMRQSLLDKNLISSEFIQKGDLSSFQSFKLINAMIGFDGPEIDVSNIVF